MNNISSILLTHNKNILNPKETSFGCNCRNKDNCPLDGECFIPNIIYCVDITTNISIIPQNFRCSIKWSIVSKLYGYVNSLSCKLCLMEKY